MKPRALVVATAVLLLLGAAWGVMLRMTWKEDATAVPAGSSAAGRDPHSSAGLAPHPGTALTPTGTAVAPTHAPPGASVAPAAPATGTGAPARTTASRGDQPAAVSPAEHASKEPGDPGAAGRGGPEPAATRYPADAAGLQRAVASLVPELRECYEGWRKVRPGLAGAMRVHMTIEPDKKTPSEAHVTHAEIADDKLGHAAVAGCVLNALSDLTFEPPEDGKLEVTYPLQFAGADRKPRAKEAVQ